jgi:hypothetical protein
LADSLGRNSVVSNSPCKPGSLLGLVSFYSGEADHAPSRLCQEHQKLSGQKCLPAVWSEETQRMMQPLTGMLRNPTAARCAIKSAPVRRFQEQLCGESGLMFVVP